MNGSGKTLKGIHRVRVKGRTYVYAWRGGPRLKAAEGTPEFVAELDAALKSRRQTERGGTLAALIVEYRQSRQYLNLQQATRADHERNFEPILNKFADAPIGVFSKPEIRKIIRKWHEGLPHDRAADKALGTLSRVLAFAMDDGLIASNPALNIRKRYEREPNPTPWTEEEIEKYRDAAPAHLSVIAAMAAATGLARADLARLSWSHVRGTHIEIGRQKTGQGTRVTIDKELRSLLDRLKRGDSTAVLLNSRGRPWTSDGLGKSFDKLRRSIGIEKTLHDLRATRTCRLYRAGFQDDEVADEMGWSLSTVRYIRRHYVDQEAMFARRVVRLSEKRPK